MRKTINTIEPPLLRKLLACDPMRGELVWLPRPLEYFANQRSCSVWNARYAGQRACAAINNTGYRFGTVLGKPMLAHRVIWAFVHGEWPEQIDHINGDRLDNRVCNLRPADYGINARNQRRRRDNTTGRTGVYWNRSHGKWAAGINANGRWRSLGYHTNFDEAVAARRKAERELGYHPNHGRRA